MSDKCSLVTYSLVFFSLSFASGRGRKEERVGRRGGGKHKLINYVGAYTTHFSWYNQSTFLSCFIAITTAFPKRIVPGYFLERKAPAHSIVLGTLKAESWNSIIMKLKLSGLKQTNTSYVDNSKLYMYLYDDFGPWNAYKLYRLSFD